MSRTSLLVSSVKENLSHKLHGHFQLCRRATASDTRNVPGALVLRREKNDPLEMTLSGLLLEVKRIAEISGVTFDLLDDVMAVVRKHGVKQ
jgi:hypothetical protein